jgi:phosphotransferase system HPr (HPr) family protein
MSAAMRRAPFAFLQESSLMRSKKLIVHNEHGIHARVALRVVEKNKAMESKVTLCKGFSKADGCSVLDMLLLCAGKGSEIELVARGGDEEKAIEAISEIFADGSGI